MYAFQLCLSKHTLEAPVEHFQQTHNFDGITGPILIPPLALPLVWIALN